MINYDKEMAYYNAHIKGKELHIVQRHLNDLKDRLMKMEQYEEVCDVYLLKMTHYYWHGQTLRALQLYLQNRSFIEQYATKKELVALRYAACLLLDTLGFYQNNIQTMHELYDEACKLQLHNVQLDTLNNLGYYYELAEQFDEAKHYYTKCIEHYEQLVQAERSISYYLSLLNIAHVYLKEQNAEAASMYLHKYEQLMSDDLLFTNLIYSARRVRLHIVKGELREAANEAAHYLSFNLEEIEYHLVLGHLQLIASLYSQLEQYDDQIAVLERSLRYANKLKGQAIQQYSISLVQAIQQTDLLEELKHDVLTGAFTRASFEQQVTPLLALRPNRTKVFVMLDVDYFKEVNDTYGHIIGDELLKTISERARSYTHPALRHQLTFGRYGGDEFYVFFEATHDNEAVAIVHDFHRALTLKPFVMEQTDIHISVTAGALYGKSMDMNYVQWLAGADRVLYEAKEQQRGIVKMVCCALPPLQQNQQ